MTNNTTVLSDARAREAKQHAVELEQCSLFVDSPPLAKAMTNAAAFIRAALATPPASDAAVPAGEVERLREALRQIAKLGRDMSGESCAETASAALHSGPALEAITSVSHAGRYTPEAGCGCASYLRTRAKELRREAFNKGYSLDPWAMRFEVAAEEIDSISGLSSGINRQAIASLHKLQHDGTEPAAKPEWGGSIIQWAVEEIRTLRAAPKVASDTGAGLDYARRLRRKWVEATEKHTDLLRDHDATDPKVRRSGQRCSALYSRLSAVAIEALATSTDATDGATGGGEGVVLDAYDAGLLGDGGGGDVDWWQDYIRAELQRAHEFYSDQVAGGTA